MYATVADQLAFADLPEDTQALVRRLVAHRSALFDTGVNPLAGAWPAMPQNRISDYDAGYDDGFDDGYNEGQRAGCSCELCNDE